MKNDSPKWKPKKAAKRAKNVNWPKVGVVCPQKAFWLACVQKSFDRFERLGVKLAKGGKLPRAERKMTRR